MKKEEFNINQNKLLRNLLLFLCLLLAAWSVYYPVTNTDIWWHLASGREILQDWVIPQVDRFAYTLDQPEWIDVHWLFQASSYTIFSLAGMAGILGAKLLLILLAGYLLTRACKQSWFGVVTALLWMISMFSFRYLMLARPSIITILFLCVYILFLERYRNTKQIGWIAALIPIQMAWTNIQGLFILGHGLLLMFVAEQLWEYLRLNPEKKKGTIILNMVNHKKQLLFVTFIHILASFINPYGIKGAVFPFKLFMRINPFYQNIFSEGISENIPLFELAGKESTYLYTFIAFTLFLIISFFVKKGRTRVFHLLMALSFGFLAIIAKRNLALFAVVFTFITAHNFAQVESNYLRPFNFKGIKPIATSFILLILFLQSSVLVKSAKAYPENSLISPFRVPVNAAEYMENHPKPGRIFTSMRYGGYLIYSLYPRKQVNIDGRMIIRDASFYQQYLELVTHPENNFSKYAESYNINRVLLPLSMLKLYDPLRKWLYHSDQWKIELLDGESVLYTKHQVMNKKNVAGLSKQQMLKHINNRFDENTIIRKEAINNYYRFIQLIKS